jgi:glycosyltransferase involved in cell wall biosynthesis
VLMTIGHFSPLLNKRRDAPISLEVADLCRRLHAAHYAVWYEPEAVVEHRVLAARLTRPYFVGRAYWQGRSEVVAQYADTQQHQAVMQQKLPDLLRSTLPEVREAAHLAFIDRTLLFFAGKPSSERLLAAMAQARSWGNVQQRLQFAEHAPSELSTPSVFFVYPTKHDTAAELLAQALQTQRVRCTSSVVDIPLSWLWQHRAFQGKALGILHLYRPGALTLSSGKRQRFWFLLWLAKRWGIRIVTTDTGGEWQSTSGKYALQQRIFERRLLRQSDVILAFTRQPDQLYPDKRLRRRVRSLAHPGFRGIFPNPLTRAAAYMQLGLPTQSSYVYLCFASHHSERELLLLVDAFHEVQKASPSPSTYLLLVGISQDKQAMLEQHRANNKTILMLPEELENTSLAISASDAVVLPHYPQHNAGMLEMAMLALSFERRIVVPDLPRFRGMLPPRATAVYDPTNRDSFIKALLEVQNNEFRLRPKDRESLEATKSWNEYAKRIVEIYKHVLA